MPLQHQSHTGLSSSPINWSAEMHRHDTPMLYVMRPNLPIISLLKVIMTLRV